MNNKKIIVVGTGGWGTALAMQLASKFERVFMWSFEKATVDEINIQHTNNVFLPNVVLPNNIIATNDINEVPTFDVIVNTVPTQFIRNTYTPIASLLSNKIIVNGAKGIEQKTLLRIYDIFNEVVGLKPENYTVISGPSHAEEVSRYIPTTIVAASKNSELAKNVQVAFSTKSFRLYTSDDVIGCELGGALKNVIAITAGLIDGLNLGDNSKAALVTRGIAEIARIGTALGANYLTFAGLSGLGDLMVTCGSKHSRNRKVGELLGMGWNLDKIIKEHRTVAEGVYTTVSAYELSKKMNIEMPITEQTYKVLFEGIPAKDIVENLMTRKYNDEIWG